MRNAFAIVAAAMLYSGALLSTGAGAVPSFQGIGFIPGGDPVSFALGLSSDGSAVVGRGFWGYWSPPGQQYREGFLWTQGTGMVRLGDLAGGDFWSEATAVSNGGSVAVGNSSVAAGGEPFRWTSAEQMVGLGTLGGSEHWGQASGVSADGATIVGTSKDVFNYQVPFRWTSSTGMQAIGTPSWSYQASAHAISGDGMTIVGSGISGTQGWRWTAAGGFEGLGLLPGGGVSIPRAASFDGSVVVGDGSSNLGPNREAFRWTQATGIQRLGDLPGGASASTAYGVSADGNVIVGESNGSLDVEAFIWTPADGMQSLREVLTTDYGLDLTGWALLRAVGVSADGATIAGYGRDPDGHTQAWIAVTPEPGTAGLLAAAAMLLLPRRRRPL